MNLSEINPHIRFVNNYGASYSHIQPERVIYDFEFMYIMSGRITIFYDGGKYELTKSDLFFFEPGRKNHMVTYEDGGLKTHCIHFDWRECPPSEDFRAEDVYFYPIATPELSDLTERLKKRENPRPDNLDLPNFIPKLPYEKFAPLFSQCFALYGENTPPSRLRLRAAFLNIIAGLCEFCGGKEISAPVHPKIRQAVKYVSEHYTESLTAEGLALKYGISAKYFGRLFKRAAGKNLKRFVNDLRLDEAKRMLLGTAMHLDEIAERLGYYDAFYFSRCFREREGVSPREFRNMTRLEL